MERAQDGRPRTRMKSAIAELRRRRDTASLQRAIANLDDEALMRLLAIARVLLHRTPPRQGDSH